MNNDRSCVVQLRNHDEEAFRHLYETYKDDVYTYALSFLRHKEYAEEIVQEVFMKIWINHENLDPERSFKSYLFTITRNLTFNFLRKAAHNKKLGDEIFYIKPETCNPIERKIQEQELEKIRREAIDLLPPGRKRIFEMSRLEDKSYEEISKELGISLSTVKNQMSKSLKTIREFLEGQGIVPWVGLIIMSAQF